MRASQPAGVMALSRASAPPVSFMVGRPDGRLTTPMSRQNTPARRPVPSALAQAEWQRIRHGAQLARRLGLEVHAGHGLNFASAEAIAAVPEIVELNIGHFLIGEAVSCGLADAVKIMRAAIDRGRA